MDGRRRRESVGTGPGLQVDSSVASPPGRGRPRTSALTTCLLLWCGCTSCTRTDKRRDANSSAAHGERAAVHRMRASHRSWVGPRSRTTAVDARTRNVRNDACMTSREHAGKFAFRTAHLRMRPWGKNSGEHAYGKRDSAWKDGEGSRDDQLMPKVRAHDATACCVDVVPAASST